MPTPESPIATSVRRRWLYGAGIAIVTLHAVLAWIARPDGIETAQDDSTYVLLAESLQHGAYRETWQVGTPPHAKYPPAYPAILVAWGALTPNTFAARSLLGILLSAAALWLAFLGVSRVADARWALAATTALSVNPYLLEAAGELRSESLYMALTMGALVFSLDRRHRYAALGAGATAILAALTRSIGITMVAAVAIAWLLERRWTRTGVFLLVAAATVGAWLIWSMTASNRLVGESYLADFTGVIKRNPELLEVVRNRTVRVARLVMQILPFRLPWPTIPGTPIDNVLGGLLTGAGLVAGIAWCWARWRLATIYLLVYVALLLVWPYASGRFFEALLPLMVPVVLIGLGRIAQRFRPQWKHVTVFVASAMLAGTGAARSIPLLTFYSHCRAGDVTPSPACLLPDQASFFSAVRFVTAALPPTAIILSAKPQPLYYYTRRRTITGAAANAVSVDHFTRYLRDQGTTHVLLGHLQDREGAGLSRKLFAHCRELDLVRSFPPRTYLFALRAAPVVDDPSPPACRALGEYRRMARDVIRPDGPRRPFGMR